MAYADRCLRKAILLFNEIKDEAHKKHIHKAISSLWMIIELILRAIIFRYKHATYDRPGKLISVFSRSILPIINISEDITPKLNSLYDLRKRTLHRTDIMGSRELRKALMLFCHILNLLSSELKQINPNIRKLLTDAEKLCHNRAMN